MNKNSVLYTVGIFFSLALICVCIYYFTEITGGAKLPFYSAYNRIYDGVVTQQAGIVIAFFLLGFLPIYLVGLFRVKTKTCFILSIIGLAATGIFIAWDAIMIKDPFKIGFHEVGPAFILYALTMLAFSVTGLIQSVRFQQYGNTFGNAREDLLDS